MQYSLSIPILIPIHKSTNEEHLYLFDQTIRDGFPIQEKEFPPQITSELDVYASK